MIEELLSNPNPGKYAVISTLLFFITVEFFSGHYKETTRTKDDWIMEYLGRKRKKH